jgi:iron complex transport system permease protein
MKTILRPAGFAALALVAVLLLMPLAGSVRLDWEAVWSGQSPDTGIFWGYRLPRVLLAALAGGALAVAGLLLQALVRDSLADPYTLGVSSGASLGAVLAISFRWHELAGLPAVGVASLAGAAGVLAVVASIASRGKGLIGYSLLLAGVTVNSLTIALILFLHSLADVGQSFAIVRWLMGGIEAPEPRTLVVLTMIVLPLCAVAFWRARDWNLLAVGEDWANARGVPAERRLRLGFLLASALTAAVTCLTGPIGFFAWMIPHAMRLTLGADHRVLLPSTFLSGAAYLAVCDTVARSALAPAEIPIGAVTALVGGPVFLLLLARR